MTSNNDQTASKTPAPPMVFYMRHAIKENLRARSDVEGVTMTDLVLQALHELSPDTRPEQSTREARVQVYVPIDIADKARAIAREVGCPLTTLVAGELRRMLSL